mgnify:CR=1 FL=1
MEKLINEFDEIVRWPKKPSDKEMIIKYLATKFDFDKKYTEKDVNKIIDKFHLFEDIPLLRRELVSKRMLSRKDDGSEYWKVK